MSEESVPHGRRTQRVPAIPEVTILWITAGLSCDGDSVSITAATQPSLEDIVLGAIPGLPRVKLHHPLLAYETGEDFLAPFHRAARGELGPFVLVIEGSIPDENNKTEGYWAALGTDPETGQPIPTCTWIDRLAPHAWAIVAAGTCATYGGIHAMQGNPTGAMGLPDFLGWGFRAQSGLPIVCVPGCPVQPDNFMETLAYRSRRRPARRRRSCSTRPCARAGSSARPCTRAATAAATTSRPTSRRATARCAAS